MILTWLSEPEGDLTADRGAVLVAGEEDPVPVLAVQLLFCLTGINQQHILVVGRVVQGTLDGRALGQECSDISPCSDENSAAQSAVINNP